MILKITNLVAALIALTIPTLLLAQPSNVSLAPSGESLNKQPSKKPNILLIVADDMGFADLGAFGSEIHTPNLDALAEQGIKLTNFHTAATCSPTRSMLLTGVDSHLVGLGNMAEELAPNQQGQPGYEGYLNNRAKSIGDYFQQAGYQTYMAGKWHLGLDATNSPAQRGFQRSFAMLSGGASHYADMRPAYAKTPEAKAPYRQDGKLLNSLPANFKYSSQFYVDEIIRNIEQDKASAKPFFAYLAFTAPHWPLQAPDKTIAKYRGRYDQGYDHLHRQRLQKQKQKGLLPAHAQGAKRPSHQAAWQQLSQQQQRRSARSMEIYAAMVDEVDQHTGRLLRYLRQRDELDNTIVIFMSDNGAEGHDFDALWTEEGTPHIRRWVLENHDMSVAAMGKLGSYTLYDAGWAWAGAPGFAGYKGYPQEGGIRVPAFVHFPKKLKPGINHQLMAVQDVLPTLLAMAELKPGQDSNRLAIDGRNQYPSLRSNIPTDNERVIAGELFGKQYIRQGNWKAVFAPAPIGNGQWQLFDLHKDLAESNDLAQQQPVKLAAMKSLMQQYRLNNGVILPNRVSSY